MRDHLKQYLKDQGIGTLIQWNGQAVHHLKALGFTQHLPHTDGLFRRMCGALDLPAVADDPRFATNPDRLARREELAALIEERLASLALKEPEGALI